MQTCEMFQNFIDPKFQQKDIKTSLQKKEPLFIRCSLHKFLFNLHLPYWYLFLWDFNFMKMKEEYFARLKFHNIIITLIGSNLELMNY